MLYLLLKHGILLLLFIIYFCSYFSQPNLLILFLSCCCYFCLEALGKFLTILTVIEGLLQTFFFLTHKSPVNKWQNDLKAISIQWTCSPKKRVKLKQLMRVPDESLDSFSCIKSSRGKPEWLQVSLCCKSLLLCLQGSGQSRTCMFVSLTPWLNRWLNCITLLKNSVWARVPV